MTPETALSAVRKEDGSLQLRNDSGGPMNIWLEPWGDVFRAQRDEVIVLRGESETGRSFDVEHCAGWVNIWQCDGTWGTLIYHEGTLIWETGRRVCEHFWARRDDG